MSFVVQFGARGRERFPVLPLGCAVENRTSNQFSIHLRATDLSATRSSRLDGRSNQFQTWRGDLALTPLPILWKQRTASGPGASMGREAKKNLIGTRAETENVLNVVGINSLTFSNRYRFAVLNCGIFADFFPGGSLNADLPGPYFRSPPIVSAPLPIPISIRERK
jgi:hypothetical protein